MSRSYKNGDRVILKYPPLWEGEVVGVSAEKKLLSVLWDHSERTVAAQKRATSGWIPFSQVAPCDAVTRLGDIVQEEGES